jgi:predicted nuclease of predicted toxin-antitoxin system
MKFLVDRCAGRTIALWLHDKGHDVVEARSLGPDPGDSALLQWAATQERVPITIDTDFGKLVYIDHSRHSGLIRLPDVPANRRIQLLDLVLNKYGDQIERGAVVTVRGDRIRISKVVEE